MPDHNREFPNGKSRFMQQQLTSRPMTAASRPRHASVFDRLEPLLARVAGADAWLAIAVGQSIGGFFALAVSLGFNTVGPALVALTPDEGRAAVLLSSIRARLVVFVPAAIMAAVIESCPQPAHKVEIVPS